MTEAKNQLEKVSKLSVNSPSVIIGGVYPGRPLRIVFSYTGVNLKTLFKNIADENAFDIFDLVCVLDKGVIVSKGRVLHVFDKQNENKPIDQNFWIEGNVAALGFLYYYLVRYGTSFSVGSIDIDSYFDPLDQWGNIYQF